MPKKGLIFLLITFLKVFVVHSQIEIVSERQAYDLSNQTLFIEDDSRSLSTEDVIGGKATFVKYTDPSLNFGFTNAVIWLKYEFSNRTDDPFWIFTLDNSMLDKVNIYQTIGDSIVRSKELSRAKPFREREIKSQNLACELRLEENTNYCIYVRIDSRTSCHISPALQNEIYFSEYATKRGLWIGAYFGIIALLILTNLFLFISIKERSYVYYALYVLAFGMSIYSSLGYVYRWSWPEMGILEGRFYTMIISLGALGGILFAKDFFDLKNKAPLFNKCYNYFLVISVLLSLWSLIYPDRILNHQMVLLYVLFLILLSVAMGVFFYRKGISYALYFVGGWLCLFVGIVVRYLMMAGALERTEITEHGNLIGSLLEVILLSLALTQKVKSIEDNAREAQDKLIKNLKEIDRIKDQVNRELEQKVKERTAEIMDKNMAIERQKRQIEEQRAIEYNIEALRAQMNPHFIFNSLNSIQRFMLKNEVEETNKYLSKFSRLIRMIFENSQHSYIQVKKEIDALNLYLELEALRFSDKFKYTLEVDERLDMDLHQIPSMLIQPYIENAIWHGLMPKEDNRILEVKLVKKDKQIHCSIMDNGVGRKESAKKNRRLRSKHKSSGMALTEKRLLLINKLEGQSVDIFIEDLYEGEKAAGTLVKIEFPYKILSWDDD